VDKKYDVNKNRIVEFNIKIPIAIHQNLLRIAKNKQITPQGLAIFWFRQQIERENEHAVGRS